jgi:hypothetical protein
MADIVKILSRRAETADATMAAANAAAEAADLNLITAKAAKIAADKVAKIAAKNAWAAAADWRKAFQAARKNAEKAKEKGKE